MRATCEETTSPESPFQSRAFQLAVFCGAAPLVVGCSLFAIWLFVRLEILAGAGVWTMIVGFYLVLLGFLALGWHWWRARKSGNYDYSKTWKHMALCALLLLSNFPAAFAVISGGLLVKACNTIIIRNQRDHAIDDVHITGPGVDVHTGSIAPGESLRKWTWPSTEGEIQIKASVGELEYAEVGYFPVYPPFGDSARVTFKPNNRIAFITHSRNPNRWD